MYPRAFERAWASKPTCKVSGWVGGSLNSAIPDFRSETTRFWGQPEINPGEQPPDCRAPSGIITRGPDAAAIRSQREEESALSSPWSSGQESVMGSGGGDHSALYPRPPKRLCPEEGPRIAVRRPQHQAVTYADSGFWAWRTDRQTYFAPGPQCPGLGQARWGPVAIQHEASGPRTVGWLEEQSPSITEEAAAGYTAC